MILPLRRGPEVSLKKVAVLASAALAASSVFLVVQPAQSALVTRCAGDAGAVTVPGDLVVPADRSCTLNGTTVLGNVRVSAGADLLAEGATLSGNLIVQSNAYADVIDTDVEGAVQGRSQFGVFVEESSVSGGVDQRNPGANEFAPFVYTFSSDIEGGVSARAGELLIESTTVSGDVYSTNGEFTDIVDSTLEDRLTVRNNALGSVVCESEIYGNAVFAGNMGTLQIGGSGDAGPCDGASFWGGDVTFNNNNTEDGTGFQLSNNIVRGDLIGTGNTPLAVGEGNRVRGETSLELGTAPAAARMSAEAESTEVAQSRVEVIQGKIADRRATAVKDAAATPDSQVLVPGNS